MKAKVNQDQKGIYLEKNPIKPIGKNSKLDKLNKSQLMDKLDSISILGKSKKSYYQIPKDMSRDEQKTYRGKIRSKRDKLIDVIQSTKEVQNSNSWDESDIKEAKDNFLDLYNSFWIIQDFKIGNFGTFRGEESKKIQGFLDDMKRYASE